MNRMKGRFAVQCHNPDGSLAWEDVADNAATTAGLNDMLSVYFGAGTQKTAWAVGLIDSAGFSALAAGDTMSSHPGWSENTAYSETTRRTWTPNAPVNGLMAGAALAFTISSGGTLKGAFLVSDSTKGGTAGILYCTALFSTPQVVTVGQVLTFNYQAQQTAG